MRVENRQRVEQRIIAGETPNVFQGKGVRRQISVAEHRAFGSARRARGIEHDRDVGRLHLPDPLRQRLSQLSERARNIATVIFIAVSLFFYIIITTPPAQMLVFVGGLNGLILPIGLSIFIYAAWARSDLMGGYRYPRWLLILGALTCALTWYMGYKSIGPIFALLTAA